jgi:hypothetical protein
LRFDDIPKLGSEGMLTLLRHTDMDDCAWALAPVPCDGFFRQRHFFLNHMPSLVARSVMRVMLTVDTITDSGKCWDAQGRIIGTLTELVEEGEITLPDVLVAELEARDREGPECPLFSFVDREAEFDAAYRRFARRSGRGATMAPPDHLVTSRTRSGPLGQQGVQGSDDLVGDGLVQVFAFHRFSPFLAPSRAIALRMALCRPARVGRQEEGRPVARGITRPARSEAKEGWGNGMGWKGLRPAYYPSAR